MPAGASWPVSSPSATEHWDRQPVQVYRHWIPSLAGRDLFEFYCATCHGRDGKGNGPVAAALKLPPPDLTRLAHDNGGAFPRQRVETFVNDEGRVLVPAHGTSDMPVWGPIFRGLDPSDTLAKVRIANVVDYIASMQAK